jgi:hypothetical protein
MRIETMGNQQSSCLSSTLAIYGHKRNSRQRSIVKRCLSSNVKNQRRSDGNLSSMSTSLSTNSCHSMNTLIRSTDIFLLFLVKFTGHEEFSIDQLYDIYMQKHALDDLAFAIEFKVG